MSGGDTPRAGDRLASFTGEQILNDDGDSERGSSGWRSPVSATLRQREQIAREEAEQRREFASKGAKRTETQELHKQLKYCNTNVRELDEVIVANCRFRADTIASELEAAGDEPGSLKQTFIQLLKGRKSSQARSSSSFISVTKWKSRRNARLNSGGTVPYDVIPTVVITGAGVRDIELATRGVSIDSSACQSVLKEGQTIVDSRLQLALSFIKDAKEGRGARLHRRNVRAMAAYRIHNSLLIRAIVMLAAIALILVTPWEPISVRQALLPRDEQVTVYEVGYWWTIVVEAVVCVVCLLFLLLKFYHLGFIQFWKKGWNRFYLLLVALFISDLLLRGFPSIPPYSKPLRPFLVIALSQNLRHAVIVFVRTMVDKGTLNVLLQIGIVIIVFAVFGVYWLAGMPTWWQGSGKCDFCNFNDTLNSMLGFYVLLTTENYPDVLIPPIVHAYESRGVFDFPVFLFFILFIFLCQVFLLNVVIAVFVDMYNSQRRSQIIAQRVRERKGLLAAFRALDYNTSGYLSYEIYARLMRLLLPKLSASQIRMTFDVMDADGNDRIDVMEFFELLDIMVLRFKKPIVEDRANDLPESAMKSLWYTIKSSLYAIVHGKKKILFNICSGILVTASVVVLFFVADLGVLFFHHDADNNTVLNFGELSGTVQSLLTTSATLCSIMLVEILVRVLAVGPKSFLFNIWNAFDAIVVLTSVTGEILGLAMDPVGNPLINSLRGVRVLRLVTISERSRLFARVFFDTVWSLIPYIYLAVAFGFFFIVVGASIFEPLDFEIQSNLTFYATFGILENTTTSVVGGFASFSSAFLLLFQLLTQSNWYEPMYAYMQKMQAWHEGMWPVASTYFVMYNFLMVLLLMNLISALVIKIFQAKQELEKGDAEDILLEVARPRRSRRSTSSPAPTVEPQRISRDVDLQLPPTALSERSEVQLSLNEEEKKRDLLDLSKKQVNKDDDEGVIIMKRRKRLSTEMFAKEMIGRSELSKRVLEQEEKRIGEGSGILKTVEAVLRREGRKHEERDSIKEDESASHVSNGTVPRRPTKVLLKGLKTVLRNPTAVRSDYPSTS